MALKYLCEQPDPDRFFLLFESTGWNDEYKLTKKELAAALKKCFYCVSAYDDEELVGFGRMVSDGILHAVIYEMIVKPEYQRKGIGAKILNMLVNKCQQGNIRDVQLFCARGKKGFYEKYGFMARPNDAPGMQWQRGRSKA